MNASRLLLAGLTLGFTAIGFAQTVPHTPGMGRGMGPHGGPGGRMGPPFVAVIDADKNGVLSAEEIAGAPAALATLDTNSDGNVTVAEIHAQRPANAPQRPTPPQGAEAPKPHGNPVMLALDADGNFELSSSEIANAATSLKTLDANSDGQLTSDELRPMRGEGRGPRHGKGPGASLGRQQQQE